MQRKKIKFFNFLRDKKIVLTLTIALFAISGSLYFLSNTKYSADTSDSCSKIIMTLSKTQIKPNEEMLVVIKNSSSEKPLTIKIYVDDLATNKFVLKYSKDNFYEQQLSKGISISAPGEHTIKTEIYQKGKTKILCTKTKKIKVLDVQNIEGESSLSLTKTDLYATIDMVVKKDDGTPSEDQKIGGGISALVNNKTVTNSWVEDITNKAGIAYFYSYKICKDSSGKMYLSSERYRGLSGENSKFGTCNNLISYNAHVIKSDGETGQTATYTVPQPLANSEEELTSKYSAVDRSTDTAAIDIAPNGIYLPRLTLKSDGTGGNFEQIDKTLPKIEEEVIETPSEIEIGVEIPGTKEKTHNYKSYICAIYKYSLNVGFALTLLMIIYAGYRYLTSAGNEAAFGEAKDVLVNSLLGFAMLLLIRMILAFLNLPYCE